MNLVLRLLTGIFAIVALSLGVPFTILGFVLSDEISGSFLISGLSCLATGLVLGAAFIALHRKERGERERRRNGTRAKAPVIAVKLFPYTRIGSMLTIDLTVRVPAPRGVKEVTRRVLVPPTFQARPGEEIEILFDPEDPQNFEPLPLDFNLG